MTVHVRYFLYCTRCNCQFHGEFGETEHEAIEFGAQQGWRRRRVKNGSFWDFCPKCWIKDEQERKESETKPV